jgi:hypothetical protein
MRKILLALVATMVVVGSATALQTGGVTNAPAMAGFCDPSACDPGRCEVCPGCCSGCPMLNGR